MSDDLPSLEHYAMKPDYGRLTGVAIATHAIRDGFLLMHIGVGCKNKAAQQLSHDWEETCTIRQGWTEVGDRDLIVGASKRAGPYLRSWTDRHDSGWVTVVSVTFLELAGEDLADEVHMAAELMPMPVALVPALGFGGDVFNGYATVCHAVITRLEWDRERVKGQVSLLGYFFDRFEGDHAGNLVQLKALLSSIGLSLGPSILSGDRFETLQEVPRSEFLIALPYLHPMRKKLRRFWKKQDRQPVATDLPMGIRGTSRWLREVGTACRADPRRVEAIIARREERVRAPLRKMQSRWRDTRVAVYAEPPLAAGLCSLLYDLGITPVLVGLRGPSLGGADAFSAVLERDGHPVPEVVLEGPSLHRIQATAADLLAVGGVEGFLGSATELNTIAHLEPPGIAKRGPFVLEIGFPCMHYHALRQMPFLGYGGVVTLAQRLIGAPRLWDDGRVGGT